MGCLKQHDLQKYINEHGVDIFIETGSGIGSGIEYAMLFPFEKIFSVEIVPELYNKIKVKDSRVNIFNCDSLTAIMKILPTIKENNKILFWLDAHLPGIDYKVKGYSLTDNLEKKIIFPLQNELETILKLRDIKNDVFIIDDYSLYDNLNNNTPVNELISGWRETYNLTSITSILDNFKLTHKSFTDVYGEGSLTLTPKKTFVG